MKLFVMAGHGGDTDYSGAVGNGYREADLTRVLSKRIKELGGNDVGMLDPALNPYDTPFDFGFAHDVQLLEVHFDSDDSPYPHGGHVIIKPGFEADAYDNALGYLMYQMFPGRAEHVREQPLKDASKAAAAGYAYRLLEVCFITNPDDVAKFVNNVDSVAIGILEAFGITANAAVTPDGVDVWQYKVNYTDAQRFKRRDYYKPDGSYHYTTYESVSAPGYMLDARYNEMADGTQIQVFKSNNTPAQKWIVERRRMSDVIHAYQDPTYVIDISGASRESEARVQLFHDNGTGAQRFVHIPTDTEGVYEIVNVNSLLPLDVKGGGA